MVFVADTTFTNRTSAKRRVPCNDKLLQVHLAVLKVLILVTFCYLFQLSGEYRQLFVGSDNLQLVIRENPVSPTRDVNAMRTSYDRSHMHSGRH